MRHPESHLQQVCLRWARLQYPVCRKLMFSVPNGAHLSQIQARILKAEGMTAGVADILFLHPSKDGKWCGLAIEFKYGKGRQSDLQKEWQKALEGTGCYCYEQVRSFEEFRTILTDWV